MKQYGILDDEGNLFGLRGTTYTSPEAAEQAYDFLKCHHQQMEQEAQIAATRLERTVGSNESTITAREQLKETVARWEREKNRTYVIRMREVGPWGPVG